jgi:hypothetical protein
MPLKGIIFLFTVVIICAVLERDKIYRWLTSEFSDDKHIEDDDNSKEEQEK